MRIKGLTASLDATKKEEILDAATQEFAAVGFKEATVRKICKAAKANVCLVSYYFGGKDGLYKAIFDRAYADMVVFFEDALKLDKEISTKEEYRTRFEVYFERLYNGMLANPNFVMLVGREFTERQGRVEETMKNFMVVKHRMIEYIAYGQKKKFIKKDLEPALVGEAMMQMMVGFIQKIALKQSHFFFPGVPQKGLSENIWKVITTIFFDGVML